MCTGFGAEWDLLIIIQKLNAQYVFKLTWMCIKPVWSVIHTYMCDVCLSVRVSACMSVHKYQCTVVFFPSQIFVPTFKLCVQTHKCSKWFKIQCTWQHLDDYIFIYTCTLKVCIISNNLQFLYGHLIVIRSLWKPEIRLYQGIIFLLKFDSNFSWWINLQMKFCTLLWKKTATQKIFCIAVI